MKAERGSCRSFRPADRRRAAGRILQAAGFADSGAAQPDSALFWSSNSYCLLPGVCLILVALVLCRYPINKRTYPRIIAGVEKRRRGEEVDLDEYRDIF